MTTTVVLFLLNVVGSFGLEFYFGLPRVDVTSKTNITLLAYTSNTSAVALVVETASNVLYSGNVAESSTIEIPVDLVVSNSSASQRLKGIRGYTEDDSLSLALFISSGTTSDAHLIFPYFTLPEPYKKYEYIALTNSNEECPGQILLVGCQNDTMVAVYPSSDTRVPKDFQSLSDSDHITIPAGSKWTVLLHKMQTLLLTSISDVLTGSLIVSDKPLTVISGSDCMTSSSSDAMVYSIEQVPPTATWGRTFFVPFLEAHEQNVTIISSLHYTTFNITCANQLTTVFLNRTEAHRFVSGTHCIILSDSPLLVSVSLGFDQQLGITSLISPIEQSSSSMVFKKLECSSSLQVTVSVLDDTSSIYLNQKNISMSGWISLTTSDVTFYAQNLVVNEDMIQTLHSGGTVISSIVYSSESCFYAYPSVYTLNPLPVVNVSFSKSEYKFLEDEGWVVITLNREGGLGTKTRVKLEIAGSGAMGVVHTMYHVIFDVWETFKDVNFSVVDDNSVEPPLELTATLIADDEAVFIFPREKAIITVLDDYKLTIGFVSLVYDEPMLITTFGIISGTLSPGSSCVGVSINLTLTATNFLYLTTICSAVPTLTVHINLSQVCEIKKCNNSFTAVLQVISANHSVTVDPGVITDTLENRAVQASNIFLISEFTGLSLLITTCIIGGLVVLITIVFFVSVIVCLSFCRYGRKWSISGKVNKLFLQDDAISLSTNDPETYELMNKLGETKTASLTINDDNEYTGI